VVEGIGPAEVPGVLLKHFGYDLRSVIAASQ
jgi:hypothetical protein